ncbi:FitA-like ribbon-helix-helix domain-containing protein [Marmoricola sp. RAF53]|uniref:FitA-like ribbon-helix-helix domain-containing protein n=1 Tax=Marmoricola sp. RAF53 TaxID=3233059 RepID=UPI003F97764E
MATVQIRNLDDDAYAVLKRRAAASGRSLQEYLRLRLEADAAAPSNEEVVAKLRADIGWTTGISADTVVELQRADRDSR